MATLLVVERPYSYGFSNSHLITAILDILCTVDVNHHQVGTRISLADLFLPSLLYW